MIKFILITCTLIFSMQSQAKINQKKMKAVFKQCIQINMKLKTKDTQNQCLCEKRNFEWLLNNDATKHFPELYTGKLSVAKTQRLNLGPLETVIFDVIESCRANKNYVAPKIKTALKKKI